MNEHGQNTHENGIVHKGRDSFSPQVYSKDAENDRTEKEMEKECNVAGNDSNGERNTPSTLSGIVQGLLGCLRPVWKLIGKTHKNENVDDWIIPFEDIRELQWLGSGAQGAVFLGVYGVEQVAVKKVRHMKDTEIKHLRDLDHPNVVRFR